MIVLLCDCGVGKFTVSRSRPRLSITNQLAKREGVTEALKAADQMEWVIRMNNIRERAEEIVLSELVYR